jgi:hypothetical protein
VPGFQPLGLGVGLYLGLRPRLVCCRAFGPWRVGRGEAKVRYCTVVRLV